MAGPIGENHNSGSTTVRLDRIETKADQASEQAKEAVVAAQAAHAASLRMAGELKELRVAILGGTDSVIPGDVGVLGRLTQKIDQFISAQGTQKVNEKTWGLSAKTLYASVFSTAVLVIITVVEFILRLKYGVNVL